MLWVVPEAIVPPAEVHHPIPREVPKAFKSDKKGSDFKSSMTCVSATGPALK